MSAAVALMSAVRRWTKPV